MGVCVCGWVSVSACTCLGKCMKKINLHRAHGCVCLEAVEYDAQSWPPQTGNCMQPGSWISHTQNHLDMYSLHRCHTTCYYVRTWRLEWKEETCASKHILSTCAPQHSRTRVIFQSMCCKIDWWPRPSLRKNYSHGKHSCRKCHCTPPTLTLTRRH